MDKKEIQYIDNKIIEGDAIQSLDMYRVSVINLNNIWYENNSKISTINKIGTYRLLESMITNSTKSKIIIILPKNQYYHYDKSYDGKKFLQLKELKEIIPNLMYQLKMILGNEQILYSNLYYENTETKIKNENIKASFYFQVENVERTLTSI